MAVRPTPGQLAIIKVAYDGLEPIQLPEAERDLARQAFGNVERVPPDCRRVICAVCGARAGKSYILAALRLLHLAFTVPLDTLAPGEQGKGFIVAPDTRLSADTFRYIIGALEGKRGLRAKVLFQDRDSVTFTRPDGKVVQISCVPATRGGSSVRGRSLFGAVLDEACFFRDERTGVVNDTEIYKALLPRILPGGQLICISTPYAETGLMFDLFTKNWGEPSTCLAVTAKTLFMRPTMRAVVEGERKRDPISAAREFDAKFISVASGHLFDASAVDAAIWKGDFPKKQVGMTVTAGVDLGFSHDSSALVVACMVGNVRYIVDIVEMMPEPGAPLSFSTVMETIAKRAKAWGAEAIVADGHYREAVVDYLDKYDLGFVPAPTGQKGKTSTYSFSKALMLGGHIRIPDNERLIRQLKEVEVRPLAGGGMAITSPTWRGGGHGDIVSAAVLALYRLGGFDLEEDRRPKTRAEREARMVEEDIARRVAEVEKRKNGLWWESDSADLDNWDRLLQTGGTGERWS